MYVETLGAALTLVEHRNTIAKALHRMLNRIKNGHVRTAVFGLGGTGKTTMGHFLSGKFEPTEYGKYQLSYITEEFRLQGDLICSIFVPGGQRRRIQHDWPDLYQKLANGRATGVINVVSYGHHAFTEVAFTETKYYAALRERLGREPTKDEFVSDYLEQRRAEEIAITREILPHLQVGGKKLWMITLVTKQDLWWKNRRAVDAHYREGEYNKLIEELAQVRGHRYFKHEYVSASLVASNLQTNDGTVLVPTAEGYDQHLQYANQANLIRVVSEFAKK